MRSKAPVAPGPPPGQNGRMWDRVWHAGVNVWVACTVLCLLMVASAAPIRIVAPVAALYAVLSLFSWATCAGRWVAARYAAPRQADGPQADYHDPAA
jgi:hypothetical protein